MAATLRFLEAFRTRDDLKQFAEDALLLFAMQLRFNIQDIITTASNSLTEGSNDKKADLVYIDVESGDAVIAQTYMCSDMSKKGAPSDKASDLNTAVSWLLNSPIDDLPPNLKSHAEELRQKIKEKAIRYLHLWYVHNLPESDNVNKELRTVEHTAKSALAANFSENPDVQVQALEVGLSTLEDWYTSISTPILVADEFSLPIAGGFAIADVNWRAYVTAIPAKWLHELFRKYGRILFSANVRDYLGSRQADKNINNGIKDTADSDPGHFWVYNNGITVLVHKFDEVKEKGQLIIKGFAIVNGSQTTGAIGTLDKAPADNAKVPVRFIMCNDPETVYDIVRYNNSQNKITAPDFRSTDFIQRKLTEEFHLIPQVEYAPRRGGQVDAIRRRPNLLPSVTAGQALAALHGDPEIAYHKKTHMWEDDSLYATYFGKQTSARHIVFAYSLLKSVEERKLSLWNKSKSNTMTTEEQSQLDFYRKRGSIFLMVAAVGKCLEVILGKQIPNLFNLQFKENLSPVTAKTRWSPIVGVASSFAPHLVGGLADGFKTRETVKQATDVFLSLVSATKAANSAIFSEFAKDVT